MAGILLLDHLKCGAHRRQVRQVSSGLGPGGSGSTQSLTGASTSLLTPATLASSEAPPLAKMLVQLETLDDTLDAPEKPPLPGTNAWLTAHNTFLEWLSEDAGGPLWIMGAPGRGKSMVAHHLRYRLERRHIVLHFDCGELRRANKPMPLEARLAGSLLRQLLCDPRYLKPGGNATVEAELARLSAFLDADSSHDRARFDFLWRTTRTLLACHGDRIILIIDSLDRYPDRHGGSNRTGLRTLEEVVSDVRKLCRQTAVRAVLLARPDPRIGRVGDGGGERVLTLTADVVQDDVQRVFDAEYVTKNLPPEHRDEVARTVLAKGRGSFTFVVQTLAYLKRPLSIDDFWQRLSSLPDTLTDIYAQMMVDRALRLDDGQKRLRRKLLETMLGASRVLSVAEMADLTGLMPHKASEAIETLCGPLVEIAQGCAVFVHSSVVEYLLLQHQHQQHQQPNEREQYELASSVATIAEEELRVLLDPQYAATAAIGRLVHHNVSIATDHDAATPPAAVLEPTRLAYKFAAQNWVSDLTRVADPSPELLETASRFLGGAQFVYWSEYVTKTDGASQHASGTRRALRDWRAGLTPGQQERLDLRVFFVGPYNSVIAEFEREQKDYELVWLTRIQLGVYLFTVASFSDTYRLRLQIAEGIAQLLGPENPLALKVSSDAAYMCFYVGRMREAKDRFVQLHEKQTQISGPENYSTLLSRVFTGTAELFLGSYPAAIAIFHEVSTALRKTYDETSVEVQSCENMRAWALLADNALDEALDIWRAIYTFRRDVYGPKDNFAVMVQQSIGDARRRRGEGAAAALPDLREALEYRSEFWLPSNFLVVDTALTLAVAYWDLGMLKDGFALTEDIQLDARDPDLPSWLPRYCQLTHLQALFTLDESSPNGLQGRGGDDAIRMLRHLLSGLDRDQENRATLWVRLDLAALLRRRDLPGDGDEADLLFEKIVTRRGEPPDDDPDPPAYLELAEEALGLVRRGDWRGADKLLEERAFQWVRPEDFWHVMGGPAADTRAMRGP